MYTLGLLRITKCRLSFALIYLGKPGGRCSFGKVTEKKKINVNNNQILILGFSQYQNVVVLFWEANTHIEPREVV